MTREQGLEAIMEAVTTSSGREDLVPLSEYWGVVYRGRGNWINAGKSALEADDNA